MKNLVLVTINLLAVVFGCNLAPAPDYRFEGWRETAPNFYARDYEKVSISTFGALYDESAQNLKKSFCIGTTFEQPQTLKLESAVIETADGKSYAAEWSNNVTLNGNSSYARKQCGQIELNWTLDRPLKEIYRSGSGEFVFNLKIGGEPETVRARVVPAKEHKAE